MRDSGTMPECQKTLYRSESGIMSGWGMPWQSLVGKGGIKWQGEGQGQEELTLGRAGYNGAGMLGSVA